MAATAIPGSSCTFKIATTAYSAQVTGYTFSKKPNVPRTKTLTDVAYPTVDTEFEISLDFLYDDDTALVGAVAGASTSGVALELIIGDTKITAAAGFLTDFQATVTSDGVTTGSATFIGEMVGPVDAP